MRKTWLLLFSCIIFYTSSSAQFTRYVVQLKDKNGSAFSTTDPSKFLSQRAIERRNRYNIPITETDLPVNQQYIDAIKNAGNVTLLNVSKWFNQVCILTTDANAITAINALPFVQTSRALAPRLAQVSTSNDKLSNISGKPAKNARPANPNDFYNYGLSFPQVHMHNAEFLHNHGFRGENMQLAIMDAGFQNYATLPTFDSVRVNKQVLATWDFVAGKQDVNSEHPHGMNCFSTIAANMPGTFMGTAPKANFYLFRTEDAASEYPVELQNFAAAAERADSAGADVFSVSLGYNLFDNANFNFTYADMNGHTTLIAKAVNIAAEKGITVVVAAGNEGNNSWHYVSTPGDADSALSIGAVNTSRQVAGFSSYGPSSNGQIKPDIAAVGAGAVVANVSTGQPSYGNGTSYACPIMAGITTCLWQAFPEVNNMEIIDALHRSGDRFANPDDRTGYGIPDVKRAFVNLQKKLYAGEITLAGCNTSLNWSVNTAGDMSCVVERKLPSDADYVPVDTQTISSNFSKQNFTYLDDLSGITSGIPVAYRIRMNIATDTSFILDSATVNYNQSCNSTGKEAIIISPNPVTDHLSIKISRNTAAKVDVLLINALGQQLGDFNYQAQIGEQIFSIPVQQYSRGLYYIKVLINGKLEKTSIIMAK